MRHATLPPARSATRRWPVFVALGLAAAAMIALHLVQPELNPVAQPVSYYVWGRHGWLLPSALAAFGLALILLARARPATGSECPRRSLILAGAALLLAAAIPSDRWFPWEQPPSLSGLLHAAAAMIAPPVLLWPMLRWAGSRPARIQRLLVVFAYAAALLASATSLLLGLWRDGPPPAIGLFERALALAALLWLTAAATTS